MRKAGGWRVKFALQATEHLDAVLSATQLGITLASLGLGWIGEPVIGHRIEPLLRDLGVTEPGTIKSISFAVAFTLITFFHIVLGELAPKSIAIQRPKAVSLNAAAPLVIFYRIFFPFIWCLNGAANRILRAFGLEPAGEGEHAFSAEELEYVFSQARHAHPGDALINRIMVRSLRLRSVTAQQAMRPRDQVVALWTDRPLTENLRLRRPRASVVFPCALAPWTTCAGFCWCANGCGRSSSWDLMPRLSRWCELRSRSPSRLPFTP
jgi:CBS domain containing-hemolysin-like protein